MCGVTEHMSTFIEKTNSRKSEKERGKGCGYGVSIKNEAIFDLHQELCNRVFYMIRYLSYRREYL
jgi:hypothetical protein